MPLTPCTEIIQRRSMLPLSVSWRAIRRESMVSSRCKSAGLMTAPGQEPTCAIPSGYVRFVPKFAQRIGSTRSASPKATLAKLSNRLQRADSLRFQSRFAGIMKPPRRRFLHLVAGAVALPAVSRIAWAQAYPSRPVRLIVPVGPAGATDITARLVGQWLSERLGQQFIIENRPGAGSNIGTEAVVRAPADGYMLLMVGPSNAINAALYDKLNFNFVRDIAPVAPIVRFPYIMMVNPAVPAKTLPEFIAYTKANPGKISMASPGIGTTPHVNGELFKVMTGINMVHVPYRSAAAVMTDLLSGQVQLYFGTTASSLEYVRAGKLRALAVTIERRLDALPDIPAVAEFVPGYEASGWFGVGAPRNTPVEIIDKLNKEIDAGVADPKMKARLADLGGIALTGSPSDFGKLIVEETEKWGKVVRAANIKAD